MMEEIGENGKLFWKAKFLREKKEWISFSRDTLFE